MTDSFWNGKKVLVTGAGGFIGSQLTETLAQNGAAVRAFVRYNSRRDPGLLRLADERVLREMEIIFGDIRDADAVTQAVRGCDLVFHLGALISIPYSYVHPREVAEVNWMGTLNVLTASRECGVGRVLHTSTSEVYGTALRVPIDEDHPLQGQSPYSASKIGADKMAESFYCAFQLPVVTVRPFNTYGPRQSARAVIPTIITQALALDEIRLGNLDTRRDFTFVSDTVRGFLCAAQAEQVEGETFNLGTGQEVTIRELLERILKIVGRDVRVRVDDQRLRPENSEVMRLLSNNQKARQCLHWQPEVSLEDGLEKTVAWIRQYQSLYRPGVYEF